MKASARCKYCEQGIPLQDGQHWIVKSVIPAHIKIVECKTTCETTKQLEADNG